MTIVGLLISTFGFVLVILSLTPGIRRQILGGAFSRQSMAMKPNYKWWVFCTVGVGIFLSVVDHGSVLVALPNIEEHFQSDLSLVQWVVVGHALAISVLLLPMGRLGDIAGRKRVYIVGFAVFVAAAAVAGFSANLQMLIVAKVIQGIGSAALQGNWMAIIISAFPGTERGKVLGINLSVVGAGAIIGPALGGLVISTLGWRWVFFINVPAGLFAIAAAVLILSGNRPSTEGRDDPRASFDWAGAALSGTALLLLLLMMGNGDRLGWSSFVVIVGSLTLIVLVASFIWWELRTPSPMLELRLFKNRLFALGVTAGLTSFLGSSGLRFMMPFYLQRVLGYSPKEVGLLLIPAAMSLVIIGPLSGRLSDKFGWRRFTMGGLVLSAAALFALATTLSESSSMVFIIGMLVLQSSGTALFNSPNNSSILSTVERSRYGVVSALTQLVRNSGNVASIAMSTTIVVITMGSRGLEPSLDSVSTESAGAFVAGLHRAFFLLGAVLTLGMILTFLSGVKVKPLPTPGRCVPAGESSAD